jgi:hypothetical protein
MSVITKTIGKTLEEKFKTFSTPIQQDKELNLLKNANKVQLIFFWYLGG